MKIEPVEMHMRRGFDLHCKGRLEDALSCYRMALDLNPNLPGLHNNMGAGLEGLGRVDEALSCFQNAVRLNPGYVEAHNNMGNVLQQMGRLDEAISCYVTALEINPNISETHNNLGNAHQRLGQISKAIFCYQKAVALNPNNAQAYCNLGNAYQIGGKIDEAIKLYEKAILLNPHNPETYTNMGAALKLQGKLEASVKCYRKALKLRPDDATVYNNLGSTLKHQGKIADAISCYRKACGLKSDYAEAHSNLIFAMHYDTAFSAQEILDESLSWGKRHTPKNLNKFLHDSLRAASEDKLKIGYVSPDFRSHSVSYFFLPLLKAHNRSRVEIFCYSEVKKPDEITNRIKIQADHWFSTVGLSDDAVAKRIHEDGIHILVDLAGHTSDNRLLVFARKPAPIQAGWLGYPGTTGLTAIDYRITDEVADPEGNSDQHHSEKLIRLSRGFLCYAPPENFPDVTDAPALENGGVTFGSFNNLSKMNEQVVELWSRILLQEPNSSLLLKSRQLEDSYTKDRYLNLFSQNGISPNRIELLPASPTTETHLGTYGRVDIALDPFPYNGTTTTCEALWMGVPVVTLEGNRHASRVGAGILSRVGLAEMIARNHGDYVEKAAAIAGDLNRLNQLRKGIRQRLMGSSLCDAESFAKSIEKAYKEMWQQHISQSAQGRKNNSAAPTEHERKTEIAVMLEKGLKYQRSGQSDMASKIYQSILELDPGQTDVLHFAGLLADSQGKFHDALDFFSRAIRINPENATYYVSLGNLFKNHGQTQKAVLCFQQALQRNPDDLGLHTKLGNLFKELWQLEKAAVHYQKALTLGPDLAGPYYNMANILKEQGKLKEAVSLYERAIELDPHYADAYNNLGNVYKIQCRLQEATSCYQKAVKINPDYAQAYDNMGVSFQEQGRIHEAIACYRKALQVAPDSAKAHSDLLFCMHYDPACSPGALYDEHQRWWQQHGILSVPENPYTRHAGSAGKLRIGYVSPDFRIHSVSFFFLPLLMAHNRHEFEIFCYSDVKHPDKMTTRIQHLADHYLSVTGLTDERLAEQISQDRIDILIDLTGHTGNNRLPVFAHRPAPVQMNWLGYPDTTGMPVMHYRLTDAIADPEGQTDEYHSETLIRMRNGFLCYRAPENAPEVSSLPALQTGTIIFGSFNNLPKVNERVIGAWSEILNKVRGASLLLKSKQFSDEFTKQRYLDLFLKNDISPDRILILPRTESVAEHLSLYNRVDIGLDPFPYNGTTTTCEALWMGVPVVTLAGNHHCSRVGASILTRIGLEELIATNAEMYIEKAVSLAGNFHRLGQLRAELRRRMTDSPICDSKTFARSIEDIYRQIRNR